MFRKLAFMVFILGIVGILSTSIQAATEYDRTLGSNKGFSGAASFTIASPSATIMPAVPSGCHEAWLWSDEHFNYGDSTVSTNTYELNWASGTHLHPLIFDKLITPNPTIYFRKRGSATPSATIYIRYR